MLKWFFANANWSMWAQIVLLIVVEYLLTGSGYDKFHGILVGGLMTMIVMQFS